VIAIIIGVLAEDRRRAYVDVEATAFRESRNLVFALQAYTTRTIRAVDQLLDTAASLPETSALLAGHSAEGFSTRLRDLLVNLPQVTGVAILDAEGWSVISTGAGEARQDLSDRDYFHSLRDGPAGSMAHFIGVPVVSRRTGEWIVTFSRPIRDGRGDFVGAVVAAVEPRFFASLFASIDVGRYGNVTLFQRDGTIVARAPQHAEFVGRSFAGSQFLSRNLPVADMGSTRVSTVIGGRDILLSYRIIDDTPYAINVAFDARDVFAEWRASVNAYVALGILSSIVIGSCVWLALRVLSNQEKLIAAARVRSIVDNIFGFVGLFTPEGIVLEVNRTALDRAGLRREDVIGKPFWDAYWWSYAPAAQDGMRDTLRRAASGETVTGEFIVRMANERMIVSEGSFSPMLDAAGRVTEILGFGVDVSARKRVEAALRESQESLAEAERIAHLGNWSLNLATNELSWSDETYRIYGLSRESLQQTPQAHLTRVHQIDRSRIGHWYEGLAAGKEMGRIEVRIIRPSGEERWVELYGKRVTDTAGRAVSLFGTVLDITDRKRVEEQLRQAQKMETVGQLTGGVAHDFNNLLGVLSGNLELLEERLPPDPKFAELVRRALSAVDRGTDLTRSLLAFARRQPLSPRPVDANRQILDAAELLRRPLGERIEIVAATSADLWLCEVDAAQTQAALLNLIVNARDAMPNGGRITLETANVRLDDAYAAAQGDVTPGQYVLIAVSDTGTGMTPEVVSRAFEPFFTTKPPGAGTGLGLSMVYGFVKQSGGHVRIYSEVGKGTSVKLYLPRFTGSSAAVAGEDEMSADEIMGRGETILLVEDDLDLRETIAAMLSGAGYHVLEAPSADAALERLRETSAVHLLLTDFILPKAMNGAELARAAAEINPRLAVVFVSGYTQNSIIHHGRLDPGVTLLQKPFRKLDLMRTVRAALDKATARSA
jgi:PAS domain S-box-containing protein